MQKKKKEEKEKQKRKTSRALRKTQEVRMMDANKTAQMEKRREKSNDARINIVHLVDFKHLGQEIVANV